MAQKRSPRLAGRARGRRAPGALAPAAFVLASAAASIVDGSAWAVTKLRVGASEYGGFSRVVLDIRPPEGWRARSLDRGIEIEIPITDLVLDDSAGDVFRRAARVAELSSRSGPGGAFVVLRFNCDCEGRAYAFGGRSIVVDVADRPRDSGALETPVSPAPATENAELSGNAPALRLEELGHQNRGLGVSAEDAPTLPSPSARPASPFRSAPLPSAPPPPGSQPIAADPAAPAVDRTVDTAEIETAQIAVEGEATDAESELRRARDLLMRKLRQAADEGLIELREDAPGAAAPADESSAADPAPADPAPADALAADALAAEALVADALAEGGPFDPAAPGERDTERDTAPDAAPADNAPADDAQVWSGTPQQTDAPAPAAAATDVAPSGPAAASALAEATTEAIAAAPATPAPQQRPLILGAEACLADERLDPTRWRVAGDFSETLAARRAVLYDALNRVQPDAVASLTRFYIGVGFYAEAMAAPATYGVDSDETRLLVEIARVLDERPASAGGPFAQETVCRGRHALWQAAALADNEPARAAAAYRRSGRELSRTPEPFRRELGARIGLAAAAAGDWDTARDIYSLLRRNLDAPNAALRLLRAELALADDRSALARRELAEIGASRDVRAPLAQIRLSQILTPPEETAAAQTLIDTLSDSAMQFRGSPLEAELIAASAQLAARFGLLGRALTDLDGALDRSPPGGAAEIERLTALRFDLIASEIAALGQIERDPAAAASGLVEEDAIPGANSITPRLRVSAGAIQTVEAVRQMPPDPDSDALRLVLAEHLLRMRAPALAALVVDEPAAARSLDAAILRARAINPPGAVAAAVPDEDLAPPPPVAIAEPLPSAPPEKSRRERRLEMLNAPAPRLGESTSPAPSPANDPSRGPGSPITRGEEILRSLEQDLELLQEVVVDG